MTIILSHSELIILWGVHVVVILFYTNATMDEFCSFYGFELVFST